MEPDFIHRSNIKRFEQLLASGALDAAQVAVTTALLEKELEALAGLMRPARREPDPPARLSD